MTIQQEMLLRDHKIEVLDILRDQREGLLLAQECCSDTQMSIAVASLIEDTERYIQEIINDLFKNE